MSRHIDADKLKESFNKYTFNGNKFTEAFNAYVDNAPTADVVEVVRCKDCTRQCICYHSAEYYCSDGERINEKIH